MNQDNEVYTKIQPEIVLEPIHQQKHHKHQQTRLYWPNNHQQKYQEINKRNNNKKYPLTNSFKWYLGCNNESGFELSQSSTQNIPTKQQPEITTNKIKDQAVENACSSSRNWLVMCN